jgi:hypothetical protein
MNFMIPIGPNHTRLSHQLVSQILKIWPTSIIYLITNAINFDMLPNHKNVLILDENDIIDKMSLRTISNFLKSKGAEKRAGWYFQQFIKMGFAFKINEDYVIWEADTIPLKEINFYSDNNKILFYLNKKEHKPYLTTIINIFEEFQLYENLSFIVEKMLISNEHMRNLIKDLESRHMNPFYITILNNINQNEIDKSGFAEYSTYAHYVLNKFPNSIELKIADNHWRNGSMIFNEIPLNEDNLKWVAKDYASISFEIWDPYINKGFILRFLQEYKIINFRTFIIISMIFIKMKHLFKRINKL